MLSKNHYAAWLYDSAAVQKEEKKKNQVLKKGRPVTITGATALSTERGGQGLSAHVVSIIQ